MSNHCILKLLKPFKIFKWDILILRNQHCKQALLQVGFAPWDARQPVLLNTKPVFNQQTNKPNQTLLCCQGSRGEVFGSGFSTAVWTFLVSSCSAHSLLPLPLLTLLGPFKAPNGILPAYPNTMQLSSFNRDDCSLLKEQTTLCQAFSTKNSLDKKSSLAWIYNIYIIVASSMLGTQQTEVLFISKILQFNAI